MNTEKTDSEIQQLLNKLPPITLEEMGGIRLMNRTDTKFVTNVPTLERLLQMTEGKYYAQEICGHRISPYATTYWDDPRDHEMFRSHQCGHTPRTKVRVRTYLDTQQTFLEIKQKDNHGKTRKSRVAVPSLEAVVKNGAGEDFLEDRSGYSFADIKPTLGNRFKRITLVNFGKTERLTIDFDLSFYNYETGREQAMDNAVVIELKRDGRVPSPVLPMLRSLRIKPSGFSKYCIGSAVTNEHLQRNRFKPRLRKIGKILSRDSLRG